MNRTDERTHLGALLHPSLIAVSVVVLLETALATAVIPLLPEYTENFDLSPTAAGFLFAAYGFAVIVLAIPAGWLTGRLGPKPTVSAGLLLTLASSLILIAPSGIVALDAGRFLQGAGGVLCWVGGLTWAVQTSPASRRAEVIGVVFGASLVGAMAGPVIGAGAASSGGSALFAAGAAMSAGLLGWTAAISVPPAQAVSRRAAKANSTRRLLGASWLVLLPSMIAGAIFVLVPLRIDELGGSALVIAAMLAAATGAEAAVSRRIGAAADRRGPDRLIRTGLALTAAALCLLAALSSPVALVACGGFAALMAMALLWPSVSALLSRSADEAGFEQGYAFAVINLAWAGGQAMGAYGGVALAEGVSWPGAYCLGAALCLATALALSRSPSTMPTLSSKDSSDISNRLTCARSSGWREHRPTKPEVRGSIPLGRPSR